MMKKGVFSMVFAFTAIFTFAQCDPVNSINENFDTWEEMNECWGVVSNGGMVYPDSNITFYSFMSPNISMYLMSPEIMEGEYLLSFDAGTIPLGGEQTEGVTIEVGTLTDNDDVSSFVSLGAAVGLVNDFQNIQIPVNFTSEAKYFAIKVSTLTPHSAVGVDNLLLQSSTAGVNDLNSVKVQAFPNPIMNELNLTSDQNIQEVKIFSASGQLVKNQKVIGKNALVNVSNLKTGIYMVQVVTDKGIQSLKVIKK